MEASERKPLSQTFPVEPSTPLSRYMLLSLQHQSFFLFSYPFEESRNGECDSIHQVEHRCTNPINRPRNMESKPRRHRQCCYYHDQDSNGSSMVTCHKCGEQFGKWEAVEAHHLSKHAVSELVEGDSSRKIVEIICRTSCMMSENNCGRTERVLKVHNMQKTLAQFEEYREMVKSKASKLAKKHPRCLADGNELLRFYGTTVACCLGMNGSSNLCISEKCSVCRIIRHGFSTTKEPKGGIGVFTSSTSGRAFESIAKYEENPSIRKALIVCRVIAGRVHKPLENLQELAGQSGFDSVAGKMGLYSNIKELYLLNPRALLPCFVVICKS